MPLLPPWPLCKARTKGGPATSTSYSKSDSLKEAEEYKVQHLIIITLEENLGVVIMSQRNK